MKRSISAFLISAVLAFFCPFASVRAQTSAKPVKLALHLHKGDSYELTTKMNQKISGSSLTLNQEMIMVSSVNVFDALSDGSLKIRTAFDRLAATQDITAGDQQFHTTVDTQDTTKNSGQMAATVYDELKKLLGISFTTEFNKTGKILSTDIGSVLKNAGMSNFSGTSATQYAIAYPDHPISVGQHWSDTTSMTVGTREINNHNRYTLQSVSGNTAVIALIDTLDGTMPQGTLTGVMRGTHTIDLTTGWTEHANLSAEMDMTIKNTATDGSSNMHISSTEVFTSKKK